MHNPVDWADPLGLTPEGCGKRNKNDHIFGQNGTAIDSHTVWQNGKTERIDVENAAPGIRPGNIHYHEADNTKWYYDAENKEFFNQKTGELAPKKVQKMLKKPDFQRGIKKGLSFLGEDK
ncbi:hypothetical protein [Celerinatantimonas sp. YJH-8]|uniref:hypothetical protein n=1 Tax=Celerinatantimonas sp. YJH-8 TaxID=3228714 RepID=UPI0038CB2E88